MCGIPSGREINRDGKTAVEGKIVEGNPAVKLNSGCFAIVKYI